MKEKQPPYLRSDIHSSRTRRSLDIVIVASPAIGFMLALFGIRRNKIWGAGISITLQTPAGAEDKG